MSFARALAVILAVSALAGSARGATPEDEAAAERLFQEAKALMAEGRVHDACTTLERAKRLDLGGGTVLALALCHEKDGRGASALAAYREALALAIEAHRVDRVRLAEQRIAALRETVSTLTILDPGDATVRVNGEAWERARIGVAVPLDGGDYLVRVDAPSKQPWETTLHLAPERDARRLAIPPLAAEIGAAPVSTPKPAPPSSDEDARSATAADENRTQHVAGLALGGVGAASLGVGAAFAILTVAKRSEADCGGHICDGASGTYDTAKTASTVASVTTIAGGVALATGVVLFLTGRPPSDAASRKASLVVTRVSPSGASIGIGGRF